jgi:histone H3/H4
MARVSQSNRRAAAVEASVTAVAAPIAKKPRKNKTTAEPKAAEPKAAEDVEPATVQEPQAAEPQAVTAEAPAKHRAKQRLADKYGLYVRRALTGMTDATVSKATIAMLGRVAEATAQDLAQRSARLCDMGTISHEDVERACRAAFDADLAANAVDAGRSAVQLYARSFSSKASKTPKVVEISNESEGNPKASKTTVAATARCRLVFPPSVARGALAGLGKRVSQHAPVFLAAVVEAVIRALLAAAVTKLGEGAAKRLHPHHVHSGVAATPALDRFVTGELRVVVPHRVAQMPLTAATPLSDGTDKTPEKRPGKRESKRESKRVRTTRRVIHALQSSTDAQLQAAPFRRWALDVVDAVSNRDWRYAHDLMAVLQGYTEGRVVEAFQRARALARHAHRQVVKLKDVAAAEALAPNTLHMTLPTVDAIVAKGECMAHGMRRLARRAGVTGVSPAAVHAVHARVTGHLAAVLNAATLVAGAQHKRTLTVDHLREGLALHGVTLL